MRATRRGTTQLGQEHAPVELLLYDNHFTPGKPFKQTDILYRSASALQVPYRVGSLVPASVRPWQAGDREEWLLQTLPSVTAGLVVLMDASDAVLMCRQKELLNKLSRMLTASTTATQTRGRVVVGAEQQLWPEDAVFRDNPNSNPRGSYPRPPMGRTPRPVGSRKGFVLSPQQGTPFFHINIGLIAGPPATVLRLLQCMKRRYLDFPRQCPNTRFLNGSYDFVSVANHTTRFGVLRGAWGWEQSCFHMYFHEQTRGLLPDNCPDLVLDSRAELILSLVKSSEPLVFNWRTAQRPHLNRTMLPSLHGVEPCVLHANSASKPALPALQLYWKRMMDLTSVHGVPKDQELVANIGAWEHVTNCRARGAQRNPNAICLAGARHFLEIFTQHEPAPYRYRG